MYIPTPEVPTTMTVLAVVVLGGLALLLAGRFYAPVIGRVLGERPDRMTPAVAKNDGRDYVPTRTPVVFAHHYASIAGAGPIIGPVIAIYFGWLPAVIWIVLGGIFLGSVHDYTATHIAVREGGKNLTVVARRYIGPTAFLLLLFLLIAMLLLVCAAFLDLSAKALTSKVELEHLGLGADQTLFRVENGKAIIGGIASMSVVVITLMSPLVGYLYLKRKVSVWLCSLLAIGICTVSIFVGLQLPIAVSGLTWKLAIGAYVLIAAGLPVWLFLQSRDFINVHLLYVGILLLMVSLIAAALRGGGASATPEAIPMSNWANASAHFGPGWPVLFVTIACGAVSGFHSLCAGGTTCKQINNEMGARRVGCYAMLLESFLALCVVGCLMVGLSLTGYQHHCHPEVGKGNAILTFAIAVGNTVHLGLGLPVAAGTLGAMLLLEGFLVTTLDTAIRLTRYMIEEGWATFFGKYDVFAEHLKDAQPSSPATTSQAATLRSDAAWAETISATDSPAAPELSRTTRTTESAHSVEIAGAGGLTAERPVLRETRDLPAEPIPTSGAFRFLLLTLRHYWVNSGIAVGLTLLIALGVGYNKIWPVFGAANQLLAAIALLVASCWLATRRRAVVYTLLPALFMLVTSLWMLIRSLVIDVNRWLHPEVGGAPNMPLLVTEVLVVLLAVGLLVLTTKRWIHLRHEQAIPTPA
jgi:carbon starvation protein